MLQSCALTDKLLSVQTQQPAILCTLQVLAKTPDFVAVLKPACMPVHTVRTDVLVVCARVCVL